MGESESRAIGYRSVTIDEQKCNGCVQCVIGCPTKAMRIRRDKAFILSDQCIDCGECIRICPREAILPKVATYKDMARYKVTALLPSPVIYTQYGEEVMPNEVLVAISKVGFDYVFDLAMYCEWGNLAVSEWLARNPDIRPAFAPICPVVVQLVARRFPELIPNIISLIPPREFGAKHVRGLLKKKLNLTDRDIGVFYVTPCPAKAVAISQPAAQKRSYLDGAFGLHDLYGDILKELRHLTEEDQETVLFKSGGFGIDWEVEGLPHLERTLSVCGMSDTLEVLEQIESGRLSDVSYVDFRVCQGGCLGGPLVVENRYLAQGTLRKLVDMFGARPRIRLKEISSRLEGGYFQTDKEIEPVQFTLDPNPIKAMKKLRKVDELTARLPGKLCAVCGAPDCRTLAEDVVLGRADLFVCPIFFRLRSWGRHSMKLGEIVEKLGLTVHAGTKALDREVSGVYVGDLLSDVMANSNKGQLWVTIQGHVNVVAIASLQELAGVLLINDSTPAEDTLTKAEEEGLPVLGSELTAFEISGRLYSLMAG